MSSCPPPRWCTGAESRSEEAAEKGGKSWKGERSQSSLDLSVRSRPLPRAATDEQQNTGTLNESTHRKKREEICVQSEIHQEAQGGDLLSFPVSAH